MVATGSECGDAALIDIEHGHDIRRIRHSGAVVGVSCTNHAHCHTIVAATSDGELVIWDQRANSAANYLHRVGDGDGPSSLLSVCTDPDMKLILSGAADGTLRIYDLRYAGNDICMDEAHDGAIMDLNLCCRNTVQKCVSASVDGTVRVFEQRKEQQEWHNSCIMLNGHDLKLKKTTTPTTTQQKTHFQRFVPQFADDDLCRRPVLAVRMSSCGDAIVNGVDDDIVCHLSAGLYSTLSLFNLRKPHQSAFDVFDASPICDRNIFSCIDSYRGLANF